VFVFQVEGNIVTVRGIRGATVATENNPTAIITATKELLAAIIESNPTLTPEEIASILFTVSNDLTAAYPAEAAREIGWKQVPLLCAREIPVPGSLKKCIRILLHWNTSLPQEAVRHVYLGKAKKLRLDLSI
jgi:chorismate mutase